MQEGNKLILEGLNLTQKLVQKYHDLVESSKIDREKLFVHQHGASSELMRSKYLKDRKSGRTTNDTKAYYFEFEFEFISKDITYDNDENLKFRQKHSNVIFCRKEDLEVDQRIKDAFRVIGVTIGFREYVKNGN